MSKITCKFLGHVWERYEKNPDKDTNDGYAKRCKNCGKWEW